jgi:hypothetical protein|tara:strand:- start:189 stop:551 length:363 start_codon:yes stop_codon:yes gene_type:complete
MANTWKKGNFGLASLSEINFSFDQLEQHFNDNVDGNFTDIPTPDGKVDEAIYTLIPSPLGKVAEPTYVVIPVSSNGKVPEPTYSMIPLLNGKVPEPTYTNIPQPDGKVNEPTYDDIGVTT